MANEIKPSSRNPFLVAADRIRQKSDVPALTTRTRNMPKAPLNDIPEHEPLLSMIDKALLALGRGVRWARGSILNLLV